jgi:hypothetical protein
MQIIRRHPVNGLLLERCIMRADQQLSKGLRRSSYLRRNNESPAATTTVAFYCFCFSVRPMEHNLQ